MITLGPPRDIPTLTQIIEAVTELSLGQQRWLDQHQRQSHVKNSSGFFTKESQNGLKTPKIVEVSVGMEINMYACAARK